MVADLTVSTTRAPLQTPIEILIEKGLIVDINGDSEADALRGFLDAAGDSARVVAEIALGTNERSLHIGVVLEDEKKLGSAHIGLGNALGFGGTNESPVHIDAIFDRVTVSVDGVALLKDGEVAEEGLRRESLGEFPGVPDVTSEVLWQRTSEKAVFMLSGGMFAGSRSGRRSGTPRPRVLPHRFSSTAASGRRKAEPTPASSSSSSDMV